LTDNAIKYHELAKDKKILMVKNKEMENKINELETLNKQYKTENEQIRQSTIGDESVQIDMEAFIMKNYKLWKVLATVIGENCEDNSENKIVDVIAFIMKNYKLCRKYAHKMWEGGKELDAIFNDNDSSNA